MGTWAAVAVAGWPSSARPQATAAPGFPVPVTQNRPIKAMTLGELDGTSGLEIVERLPLIIPPNENNTVYLETKRDKLGHLLDLGGPEGTP